DFFTIGTIFYIASILYVVSGVVLSSTRYMK
ncbi:MFS transporter, partial [Bacillus sp. WL1]|nr:MFS transporter [Bacillus sp. WL1]